MNNIILYHGSPEIVRKPEYGKGKPYNDYGQGFYCTESLDLAKEWACGENTDGVANRYEINPAELRILNLNSETYTILHWLALLTKYRGVRISTPTMKRGIEWLNKHFLPEIEQYDAIIGYRADDSYFSFARAFVNNEISLNQLSYAMRLGELGEQFVLKSEKAFSLIRFISSEEVPNEVYFPKRKQRDDKARAAYREEIEREDLNGLFIRDIVKEGILPDDPRLR
jgi:hypothetical protein